MRRPRNVRFSWGPFRPPFSGRVTVRARSSGDAVIASRANSIDMNKKILDIDNGGMTSSSSCARAADILDLDRYMRSSVRPSFHHTRDRLVVDAGGADRVPLSCSSAESVRLPRAREHAKRYSHDSGLSEDSYVNRRHRLHRRISDSKRQSIRTVSKSPVFEFRAACEQALRDQQEQIARVAELCQKLVQPQLATNQNLSKNDSPFVPNLSQNNAPNIPNIPQPIPNFDQNRPIFTTNQQQLISTNFDQNTNIIQERVLPYNGQNYINPQQMDLNPNITKQNFSQNVNQRIATDSSDVSSTSCSSRELRRKEKMRSDSCKTYKIIMNKLDELNHLFANRRAQPAVVQCPIVARQPFNSRPSSECVSVCNKLVATDECGKKNKNSPIIQACPIQVVHTRVNRGQSEGHSVFNSSGRTRTVGSRLREMEMALDASCGSESQGEGAEGEALHETSPDFDLNNPLRLYEQAKRLPTLDGKTRRTIPSNRSPDKLDDELDDQLASRLSLCAICRGYWRALRRYLPRWE